MSHEINKAFWKNSHFQKNQFEIFINEKIDKNFVWLILNKSLHTFGHFHQNFLNLLFDIVVQIDIIADK